MAHLELLLEELSAEVAMQSLLPKILGPDVSFRIHPHQGKSDLIGKLPGRLAGYRRFLPVDWRVVVLVDEDRQDCLHLKNGIVDALNASGLSRRAQRQGICRIAVEELEAWFLGDVDAIVGAFPGVPPSLGTRSGFRDPDAVRGGTWEALARVLANAGYFKGVFPKIEVARRISAFMEPGRNRSRSFQAFRDGLRGLV